MENYIEEKNTTQTIIKIEVYIYIYIYAFRFTPELHRSNNIKRKDQVKLFCAPVRNVLFSAPILLQTCICMKAIYVRVCVCMCTCVYTHLGMQMCKRV